MPFVAHIISHAWFHNPKSLWAQQDEMLKVQAVWANTHIVAAANKAVSKVYTPEGDVYVPPKVAEGDSWLIRYVEIPKVR